MPFDFKFPDVGEGITEGEIVKWKIKEGDVVKQDQVIAEIETDKAIVEIPSPKAGTILRIYHKEGDTIKVGENLVTIGEQGEHPSQDKPTLQAPLPPQYKKEPSKFGVVGELQESEEELRIPTKTPQQMLQHLIATPATRRIARELNINLAEVKGSGEQGRITEDDVRNHAMRQTQEVKKTEITVTKKYDFYGHIKHIPLKGIRKVTAKNMVKSYLTIPHVTHTEEIDVTDLWNIREKEKKKLEKEGVTLTFLPFIVKALIASLKKHPYLNASLDEEHEEIILKEYYNIGIAVATEDGLLVPVIKGAEEKSLTELAQEMKALADKAKKRELDLGDFKGGTFTITNIGSIGGIFATPIINYPEAAILATGKIRDKPAVINNKVEIRKILPVSLTFDHRILDGAEAALFTNDLKEFLEDPDALLFE